MYIYHAYLLYIYIYLVEFYNIDFGNFFDKWKNLLYGIIWYMIANEDTSQMKLYFLCLYIFRCRYVCDFLCITHS